MPSLLSKEFGAKVLGSEWSFGYNCYEVGHTWTPDCLEAALEISTAAGMKVLPLYAMLYTFSQLAVQRKYDLPASWETVKSILRSSSFIFFNAYNGSAMGCALRNGFGRFYYRVLVCAPALISSYLALLIEKPARRQALAFYMLNLASEILYRMATTKGYFRPLKHGETLLFALSLGAWYHLLKAHGFGHDPVSAAVKVLIGRDEAKSRSKSSATAKTTALAVPGAKTLNHLHTEDLHDKNREDTNLMFNFRWLGQKHPCCPHEELSCWEYGLRPIATRFLLGYSIQFILKLSSRPIDLIQAPQQTLAQAASHPGSIKFGLFLASLVSSGRLTSCLLRRYSQSNEPNWHAMVSGFVAGLSMFWAPRSSLSMYVMWKAVEQYYLLAAKQGKVKYFELTILSIYSISAAIILYTFALEPRYDGFGRLWNRIKRWLRGLLSGFRSKAYVKSIQRADLQLDDSALRVVVSLCLLGVEFSLSEPMVAIKTIRELQKQLRTSIKVMEIEEKIIVKSDF